MENAHKNQENKLENKPENKAQKKTKLKAILKDLVIFAVIALGIVLPFRIYIAEPYLVDGQSMDPTFATGDYLIVDKLSYRLQPPKRNTVVVFTFPYDNSGKSIIQKLFNLPNTPKRSFIKRIIGLPGETIEEKDNVVTIYNTEHPEGFKVDQSYVFHESPATFKTTLSSDEYFVMGDNRAESYDSRSWGPLNKKFIAGKPILRLLPITKISTVPGEDSK